MLEAGFVYKDLENNHRLIILLIIKNCHFFELINAKHRRQQIIFSQNLRPGKLVAPAGPIDGWLR
jgi:hypothetical protein